MSGCINRATRRAARSLGTMPDQRQWPGLEVIAVERVGMETQFFVPEQFIELLEYRPLDF
jgi:hypothetical protein